jgi:hypothetical protein
MRVLLEMFRPTFRAFHSPKLRAASAAGLVVALIFLLAVSGWRVIEQHQIPGPFDPSRQGFCDFHNGVYFPSLAFSQRLSPYGQEYASSHPVERSIPFFSPASLALHLPFSVLRLPVAEVIYFFWMVSLVMGIATLVARWVVHASDGQLGDWKWHMALLLAIGIVSSRGGQQTLFTGYFTFELILATLIAVHYSGKRPVISGMALAWVAIKPNYILPIGLLLLSRGHWRALVIGASIAIAMAVASFAWIMPSGGIEELIVQIQQTQEIHRLDEIERPSNNWTRVDLLAVLAKWLRSDPTVGVYLLCMLLLLAPVCALTAYRRWSAGELAQWPPSSFAGRRAAETGVSLEDSAIGLQGGLLLLTSLICVYHQVYDSLLMVGVVASLCFYPGHVWLDLGRSWRRVVCLCLLFPSVNYLSSQKVLQALAIEGTAFQLVTSLNALTLLAAWCIMLYASAVSISATRRGRAT